MKKPEPLFYIEREEHSVAGPYDLVQMAGLLRRKIITAESLTRLEGEEEWKPFSWQAQFSVAKEMPRDAVSTRADAVDEEACASRSPIPLPSADTLMRLGGMVFGSLLAGAAAFLLARLDATLGFVLVVAGGGAALVAQCMILVRLLDEGVWTLLFVFFVPFGEVFYFICNFWEYFIWFCVKYVGVAVMLGAVLGMVAHH